MNVIIWLICAPFVFAGFIAGFLSRAFMWGWEAGSDRADSWVEDHPAEQPQP